MSLTIEQVAALSASTDARLASTATKRQPKKAVKKIKNLRSGHPDQVYNAVSGRPIKMLGRVAVENKLRRALKSLTSAYESGLRLSRMLDLADLEALPATHPLVERAAEALRMWEAAQ